jgi:hypothetical protein
MKPTSMDVFDYFAEQCELVQKNFTGIYNSFRTRVLKQDIPGLFEFVLATIQQASFKNCLLLDDSPATL